MLGAAQIAMSIARNQAHRTGIVRRVAGILRKRQSGASRARPTVEAQIGHTLRSFDSLRPHLGDVRGKVGLEIGPGEHVGLAYCFLRAGAERMLLVEQLDSIAVDDMHEAVVAGIAERRHADLADEVPVTRAIQSRGGPRRLNPDLLDLHVTRFEALRLDRSLDFIYSIDVMEHVADPHTIYRAAGRLLHEGGLFVNLIDLAGHNAFSKPDDPLDFLTCPDLLYHAMYSHIVSANRVRLPEFVTAARGAGFTVDPPVILKRARPEYVRRVRPRMLPRYRAYREDELAVLECVLVARKAGG
jgi:SAM-dependent methyltransferase